MFRVWRSTGRCPAVAGPFISHSPALSTSNETSSPRSAAVSAPPPRSRRRRRTNYADYDRVLREEMEREGLDDSTASLSLPYSPSEVAAPLSSSPYVRSRSAQSMAAKLAKCQLYGQLSLYQTGGGVARVMSKLADMSAYTAYLHGSVDFFIRSSQVAPLEGSAFPLSKPSPSNPIGCAGHGSSNCAENASSRGVAAADGATETSAIEEERRRALMEQIIKDGGFAQAALLQDKLSSSSTLAETEAGAAHSSDNRVHRGFLQHRVLDCVYIGKSEIHSRGLFTAVDLPKGTCVIREPRRAILAAPSFLKLLADTHQQLPDTLHYTHPTGALLELIMQPLPHHLLNHSCTANVCCGLSPPFWAAAATSGNQAVLERLTTWSGFADPNSFFVTRDVRAGEELTLDYGYRMAPMFAAENAVRGRTLLMCRCGSPRCRHFVYQQAPEVLDTIARHKKDKVSCFQAARELLQVGFDEETTLLSYLPSRRPIVSYLYGDPIHELAAEGKVNAPLELHSHSATKADLLGCYRHVFKLLNAAAPAEPP